MKYLTLQLKDDLREEILYSNHSIPCSICIDYFDQYLGQEWSSHWHDEYEYGLVLEGAVEFTIYVGGKTSTTIKLEKGDGVFIGSGFLHSVKATVPGTVMAGFVISNAFFNIKYFENVMQELTQPVSDSKISHLTFAKDASDTAEILSTLNTLCHIPQTEPRYTLHCVETVLRLWRLTMDHICQSQDDLTVDFADNSREQRLKLMVSYIHSHYSENVNISEIAKYAGISRTECFRCFQGILKKTPTDYLTEYRLSMAGMLLASTDRSLADIAYSCGFNNLSYFGKVFKDRYGVSPGKYQRSYNNGFTE